MFKKPEISKTQRVLEVTDDEWDRIMRVNGLGLLLGTEEAAEQFRRRCGEGKIIWDQLDAEFIALGETQIKRQPLGEFGANILVGRLSAPEDIAPLAVFLAPAESDYISGQAINVDGGVLVH
jgi:NAD(P)-dependent dehydrogenase (short-subunit alcohol dehydrogenase family)